MKSRTLTITGATSIGLLAGVATVFALVPAFLHEHVGATNNAAANVGSSVSLEASNAVINVTPSAAADKGFGTGSSEVRIITSSPAGYTLTMESVGGDSLAYAAGQSSTSVPDIPTITETSGLTGTQMSVENAISSWGYTFDPVQNKENDATDFSTTFLPISTSSIQIADTDNNTRTDPYTVGFGVHAAGNTVSGKYSREILFTAIAKGVTVPPTVDETTMQEWRGCAGLSMSTASDDHIITLTDSRDNNTYTVAKLADDKCWMTQNLILGGNSEITLTSADTNVPDSFTDKSGNAVTNFTLPKSELRAVATATEPISFSSYDQADVYVATQCGNSDAHANNSAPCGGYYTWYTATAGWGTQAQTTGNSPRDICPKGWRLPTKDEYTDLIGSGKYNTNTLLTQRPVPSFKYGGMYDKSATIDPGLVGYYWLSTADGSVRGHYLRFRTNGSVSGGDNGGKYRGFSVRCVYDRPTYDFQLSFNSNGGAGEVSGQSIATNDESRTFTIPSLTPSKSGDTFKGWATSATATATEYQPGGTVTLDPTTPTVTLYAVWDSQIKKCPSGTTELTTGTCWKDADEIAGADKVSGSYRLYTWNAATAQCASLGTGYRLPTLDEFTALITTYPTGPELISSPVNMQYGGNYNSYRNDYRYFGSNGLYWSFTEYNSNSEARVLYFTSSSAEMSGNAKDNGRAARCVIAK